MPTSPEQVAGYLSRKKPMAYCDDCIADALKVPRHEIPALTIKMSADRDRYTRVPGRCVECKTPRDFVIRAR